MINLKALSIAAATVAMLAASTSYVSAQSGGNMNRGIDSPSTDAPKGPVNNAPGASSGSTGTPGMNRPGSGDPKSGGIDAPSSNSPSGPSTGASGQTQCSQISDPQARQACMQRGDVTGPGSAPRGNSGSGR